MEPKVVYTSDADAAQEPFIQHHTTFRPLWALVVQLLSKFCQRGSRHVFIHKRIMWHTTPVAFSHNTPQVSRYHRILVTATTVYEAVMPFAGFVYGGHGLLSIVLPFTSIVSKSPIHLNLTYALV